MFLVVELYGEQRRGQSAAADSRDFTSVLR